MLTPTLLVALVLGQAVTPVKVIDPSQPSAAVTTTPAGPKRGLDVNIVGGSTSGGLTNNELRNTAVSVLPTPNPKIAANPLVTAVSVSDTATALPAVVLTNRVSFCVYNNGLATMFVGDAAVTTTTGLPVPAGGAFCDDVGAQPYFAIVATGTVNARVLEN